MSSFYLGKKELLRLAKAVFTHENFVIVDPGKTGVVDFYVHPIEDAGEKTPIICFSSSLPISKSELKSAIRPAVDAGLTGIQLLSDGEFTPEAIDQAEDHQIDLTGGKQFQAAMEALPAEVKKKPLNSEMADTPTPLPPPQYPNEPMPTGDVAPPPTPRKASYGSKPQPAPPKIEPIESLASKPVDFDKKEGWKRASYGAKSEEEIKTSRNAIADSGAISEITPPPAPAMEKAEPPSPFTLQKTQKQAVAAAAESPSPPPSEKPEFFQPIAPATPKGPPPLPATESSPAQSAAPAPPPAPAKSFPNTKVAKPKRKRAPVVGLLAVVGGLGAAVYMIGPSEISGKIQQLIAKGEPQSNTVSSPKGSVAVMPPPPAKASNSGQPNDGANAAEHARQILQISQAAKAAGHDFLTHGDDLDATVAGIVEGITIQKPGSPFDGNYFGLPGLTDEQIQAAKSELAIAGSVLTMRSTVEGNNTQLVSPPIPSPSTTPKLSNSIDATPKQVSLPAPPAPVTTQQPLMPVGGGQSMRSLAPMRFNVSSLRGDQKYGDAITAWLRELWQLDTVKEPNLKESFEFCLAIWNDAPQLPMTAIEFDNRRSKAEINPRLIHALLPLIGENDEITLLKHAFESDWDLDGPDADPVIRFHMRCRLAMLTETSEDRDAAFEALNGLLDSQVLDNHADEVAHEILFNEDLVLPFIAKHSIGVWRNFSSNPNQPADWLASIMKGHFHVGEARAIRGAASADLISDEELKLVSDYLGFAGDSFQRAWMQNPTHPDAAAQMILVSSTLRGTPTHEMRRWFDRSVAVQADYPMAYSYMFDGLGPNWHGSERMMIEFGRTCLKTKRYDLGTPLQLLNAHVKAANLKENPREYFAQLVAEDLAELELMFAESIADPRRKDWRTYDRSLAALTWWSCGRRDRALEYLNEVKYRVDLRAFQQLGVDPVVFWRDFAQNQGAKITTMSSPR